MTGMTGKDFVSWKSTAEFLTHIAQGIFNIKRGGTHGYYGIVHAVVVGKIDIKDPSHF
jgi:hypothetical protein